MVEETHTISIHFTRKDVHCSLPAAVRFCAVPEPISTQNFHRIMGPVCEAPGSAIREVLRMSGGAAVPSHFLTCLPT